VKVLSLFSGGGLGDYGLTLAGMEIIGQVEIDDYCQKILKLRWPDVPKWKDIKNVRGEEVIEKCGRIDLISGGFPCQDISALNTEGLGIEGERSGLWKEMFRIICEIRPRYAFMENSPMLTSRGLGTVLGDLASVGYDSEWECLPASAFGAPHQRDRIWIVAYPTSKGLQGFRESNPDSVPIRCFKRQPWGRINYDYEMGLPCVPENIRMDDGTPYRVDRVRMLGNGQVVQVVEWIGKRIMEFETLTKNQ